VNLIVCVHEGERSFMNGWREFYYLFLFCSFNSFSLVSIIFSEFL